MSAIPHQSGAECPSCGRFVGPLEKCPFCGANVRKRLPLKYLRLACLVLALAGIAILLYAVSGASTPTAKIGNVGATMNYAYVKIKGTVVRGPIYDVEQQSLRFYVADDTGEIQASAFREVTEALVAANRVPKVGDAITVEGTLRVRDDFTALNAASADKLQLTPPTFSDRALSEIDTHDEFAAVRVRGDVREIRTPYAGLTLVTLGDAERELDVAITGDTETLYGALPAPALGDVVEAQGIVTNFRDSPQLVLRHPDDFRKLEIENTAAMTTEIGALDAARVNQRVRVAGQVVKVSEFSQGVRVTIEDATGEIILLLWRDILAQIVNPADLKAGAQVEVVGKVAEYRGAMELVPDRGEDVQIIPLVAQAAATALPGSTVEPTSTPQPTRAPTPVPVVVEIGSLTENDVEKRVIVTGKIARASKFSQGMRYTLDDSTGTILLILWTNVLETVDARAQMLPGATVRVTGAVKVFDKQLEVIPDFGGEVELLAPAPVVIAPVRPIDSITTDDLDATIQVEGIVTELTPFSAGKYATVTDASGTIRVTVFDNVLDDIETQLNVGAAVTVEGKVNVFRGNLEIVASDVTFP
ncbi:MAG: exodeoxyribonuclease VII large subunit [Anaerolineae bacterium]|nr:exodeoxyribonuclease VII large subunit [Anaerolineae bacterium]